MLLQTRVGPPRRIFCRGIASYSPKVRAFPFKVSPSEAIFQLSLTPAAGGDLQHRLSTRFGSTPPIQPKTIVPVYFPAWLIDAEVEAKVTPSSSSGNAADGYVTAVFLNSYLPGHTMDKLSSVSLLTDSLALTEAVPLTPEIETQWDTKITCLPFKTAPFSVVDGANSLKDNQRRINEIFSLGSVTVNLICAYPVLIPLYLARYSADTTVVLEAYHETGRILEERRPDEDVDPGPQDDEMTASLRASINHIRKLGLPPPNPNANLLVRFLWKMLGVFEKRLQAEEKALDDLEAVSEGLFRYHRGGPTDFVNVGALTIPPAWTRWNFLHFRDFRKWLDGFRKTGTLAAAKPDEMDDPRVRPFTKDEVLAVRKFFLAGQERAKVHTVLDSMSRVKATGAQENHEAFKEYAASVDSARKNATPRWWDEWYQKSTDRK